MHVPVEAVGFAGAGLVGQVLAVLERVAGVLVDGGVVGGGCGGAEGIVLGLFAEGIDVRALVAGVETAGGDAHLGLQLFGELAAGDAEVGLDPVGGGNAGVAFELCGDFFLLRVGQVGALQEGRGVGAEGELLHFFQEGFELGGLVGDAVVIPGGGGHGGQGEEVAVVGAGIAVRAVGARVEAEDLREEDGAVEIELALQQVGENGGARGAVALAEEILRRVPAIVLGEEAADEAVEGVRVGIDAVEGLAGVLAEDAAEAGAGSVDEDEVADVEEAVFVGNDLVGCAFLVRGILRQDDAHGAEGAHVEIHGGGAGAAVVEEGDGAVLRRILLEVGGVEHARGGGAIFGLGGQVDGGVGQVFAVEADHGVLRIGGADGEGAGDGAVGDGLAADGDGAFGGGVGGSIGGGDSILASDFAADGAALFCAMAREAATRPIERAANQRVQSTMLHSGE